MVETPTDEIAPLGAEVQTPPKAKGKRGAKKGVKRPSSANRYKLFDDDEGDYRIYEVAGVDTGLPRGSLLPIAEVPGFEDTNAAKKFVNNSGDLLNGKQIIILKGIEMCSIQVRTVQRVVPTWKPRRPVTGPASTEEGGE